MFCMRFSRYEFRTLRETVYFPAGSTESGDGEIRTLDPLLARQVLSQLSYTPERCSSITMGLSGLEPPTSRLSGVRSNQLSYSSI